MNSISEKICQAGRIMFSKRLTDLCGGNISSREGDTVYMSPRYAGQEYHWDLKPEIRGSGYWADDEITNNPRFSREGWSHLFIYRNFPDVQSVIHAHPFHIMPFSAFGIPMEPVLEATMKFGIVGLCEPAAGHTKELGEKIIAALRGKEALMIKQAAAVMIPTHGIILCGKDFDKTLDALERIDVNAYALTVRKALMESA